MDSIFIVQSGSASGQEISLNLSRPVFVIGSDTRCDFQLVDPGVGPAHAVVAYKEGLYYVKARYAGVEILVNNQRIKEEVALKPGDSVQVGEAVLLFQQGEAFGQVSRPESAVGAPPAPAKPVVPVKPVQAPARPVIPPQAQPVRPAVIAPSPRSLVSDRTVSEAVPQASVYYPVKAEAAASSNRLGGLLAGFVTIAVLVVLAGYAVVNQINTSASGEFVDYPPGTVRLLMFYADWCPYCKQQDPIVRGLDRDFGDAVTAEFVDVENPANRELVARFGATSIPVTVVMNNRGEVTSIWRGLTTKRRLERAVEKVLLASEPDRQPET